MGNGHFFLQDMTQHWHDFFAPHNGKVYAIHERIYLFIYVQQEGQQFIYLPIYLSVHLSIYPSIYIW